MTSKPIPEWIKKAIDKVAARVVVDPKGRKVATEEFTAAYYAAHPEEVAKYVVNEYAWHYAVKLGNAEYSSATTWFDSKFRDGSLPKPVALALAELCAAVLNGELYLTCCETVANALKAVREAQL